MQSKVKHAVGLAYALATGLACYQAWYAAPLLIRGTIFNDFRMLVSTLAVVAVLSLAELIANAVRSALSNSRSNDGEIINS